MMLENAMQKFRDCGKQNCLLIQCYLPISTTVVQIDRLTSIKTLTFRRIHPGS